MPKRDTFWTAKRLIELRVLSRTLSPGELCEHFKRPLDEIQQAQNFEANTRRLKIKTETEVVLKRKVKVTYYAPAYAADASEAATVWGAHQFF